MTRKELSQSIAARLGEGELQIMSQPFVQLATDEGTKGLVIERRIKVASTTYKSLMARNLIKGRPDPKSRVMLLTDLGVEVNEWLQVPKWKNCGHEKTPENTQHVGVAGDRCRTCRNEMHRQHRLEGRRG